MKGNNYAELATKYGSGCLNIDGGRVPIDPEIDASQLRTMNRGQRTEGTSGQTWGMSKAAVDAPQVVHPEGRYPANLILECTCEETRLVDAPVCGSVTGEEPSQHMGIHGIYGDSNSRPSFQAYRGKAVVHTDPGCPCFMLDAQAGDEKGGPSRFFYNSKAIRREREAGLLGHALCVKCGQLDSLTHINIKTNKEEKCIRNDHPTVKPVRLCKYLATLLLPPPSVPGRRILVPFSGSGSEMLSCLLAGWDEVIGVEQDAGYCEVAWLRCGAALRGEYGKLVK